MVNLSIIIFSSLCILAHSAPSNDKCSINKCRDLINSYNGYAVEYPSGVPPAEVSKNMTTICQKIEECLKPLDCGEGKENKEYYFDECLELEDRIGEFSDSCFPGVMDSVYSEEYSCSKKFDFFNKDLLKQREAFKTGKSCFMEIAQKECEAPAVAFLKKRYEDFTHVISTKPTRHDKCAGLHYDLKKLECLPLQLNLKSKMDELKEKNIPMNDTRVPKVVELCRKTQKCTEGTCGFSETQKKDLKGACDVLELSSSSFSACLLKIQTAKPKPDFKKYTCLSGINIYNEDKNNICEKFHKKADCMKTVMTDFCGKEQMGDYQKMVNLLVNQMKCK